MSEDNKSQDYSVDEAPDILIQDLEDVTEDAEAEENSEQLINLCLRCESPVDDGVDYCDECQKEMTSFPIRKSVGIWVFLTFVVCVFSVLLLGVNSLVANPVLNGDVCLAKGDIEGCYSYYAQAYNLSQTLQKNLFANSKLSYFSVGSKTLAKQIIALEQLNGTVSAGEMINNFFHGNVPKNLRTIKAEYDSIEAFVGDVNTALSEYNAKLEGEAGDYEEMKEIIEKIILSHPDTPEYITGYYRFMLAYSMADDPSVAASFLDKVIEIAPDELWLYASEGIAAYKEAGEYGKALSICNRLLKVAPTDQSAVAYTVSVLRLLGKYDEALTVYQSTVKSVVSTPELERQMAIILMLQGDTETAEETLLSSFSTQGATLEHLATLVVCAHANESAEVFEEYKKLLDGYATFEQVDAFIAGETTIEEIFLSGGGEIY